MEETETLCVYPCEVGQTIERMEALGWTLRTRRTVSRRVLRAECGETVIHRVTVVERLVMLTFALAS
ncbi:MAG: hypothetical protein IKD37_07075 [Clostridia bacterium]|nr:hypothetical protein [Clostridia bacterium]